MRKYKEIYKGINEINDMSDLMDARHTLMTYKLYTIGSTFAMLIILLYTLLTWN